MPINKSLGTAQPVYIVDEQSKLNITYQYVTGAINAMGDNVIVTNPGTGKIVITNIIMQIVNESANYALLKSDTIDFIGINVGVGNNGIALNVANSPFKTLDGEDLIINLSATEDLAYAIQYYIE